LMVVTDTSRTNPRQGRRPHEREPSRVGRSPIAAGTGRLRPRARLLRTIGAELISSELVAIIELVRNSYDADASRVEVRFDNAHDRENASLQLWDNGHGMTREVLLGPWLEPATDFKASGRTGLRAGATSPEGRQRLGSKGVGRFAAQRLGAHLHLRTRPTGSSSELEADFDWTRLDGSDGYLDEVEVPWSEHIAEPKFKGTLLHIRELRDEWEPERFSRLKLALSRLVGPGFENDTFEIDLVVDGATERIRPMAEVIQPMYSLWGEVTEGGVCVMHYQDISMTGPEEWHRQVSWPARGIVAGPMTFRINAWDLDRPTLERYLRETGTGLGLRDFRRVIREHSGVSLYRDGFRVLPYGEPDNDWLRLDRRRVNNPTVRLSNNQLLGWVALTAQGNSELRDQTNREGLVSNDAYLHLQTVVTELLSYLENRRFGARRQLEVGRDEPSEPMLPGLDDDSIPSSTRGEGSSQPPRRAVTDHPREQTRQDNWLDDLAAEGILKAVSLIEHSHAIARIKTALTLSQAYLAESHDPQSLEDVKGSIGEAMSAAECSTKALEASRPPSVTQEDSRTGVRPLAAIVHHAFALFDPLFAELDLMPEITTEGRDLRVGEGTLRALAALLQGVRNELSGTAPHRRIHAKAVDGVLELEVTPPLALASPECRLGLRLLASQGADISTESLPDAVRVRVSPRRRR
jgi:hypothetical protein